MSSILKALKKIEEDRTGRRTDEVNINAAMLRPDNAPRFSSTSLAVSALLLVAAGSVATYIIMKPGNPPDAQTKPATYRQQAKAAGSVPSAIKTEQLPEPIVVVPAGAETATSSDEKSASARTVRNGTIVPANKPRAMTLQAVPSKPSPAATPLASAPPPLRVNGIAFQNNGADSVAIINDQPVTNGSVIEGATIEEIRKDRVLFQRNGEHFEILLGQANR